MLKIVLPVDMRNRYMPSSILFSTYQQAKNHYDNLDKTIIVFTISAFVLGYIAGRASVEMITSPEERESAIEEAEEIFTYWSPTPKTSNEEVFIRAYLIGVEDTMIECGHLSPKDVQDPNQMIAAHDTLFPDSIYTWE